MDHKELSSFLKVANKATYANSVASKAGSLRPASEDYHFEQGDLTFHDTYFGGRDFMGEEIVYKNNKPMWGMNYYGRVLKKEISTNDAYAILRPALMQEYDDILPVRGPRKYVKGSSIYTNTVEGTLDNFKGVEEISIDGEVICRCQYHGGMIA